MRLTPSPLSQTVTPSRTPSSVTYFMDGPLEKKDPWCIHTIRQRQRRWVGHTLIKIEGLAAIETVMEGKMERRKTRGRPRQISCWIVCWRTLRHFRPIESRMKRPNTKRSGDVIHVNLYLSFPGREPEEEEWWLQIKALAIVTEHFLHCFVYAVGLLSVN